MLRCVHPQCCPDDRRHEERAKGGERCNPPGISGASGRYRRRRIRTGPGRVLEHQSVLALRNGQPGRTDLRMRGIELVELAPQLVDVDANSRVLRHVEVGATSEYLDRDDRLLGSTARTSAGEQVFEQAMQL